jgi:catecholate siderophore receptor
MLCLGLRTAQRVIQSKASLVGVAALFYLTAAVETDAEQAASEESPAAQQAPAPTPQEVPAAPAQADQPTAAPAQPDGTEQPSAESTPTATKQNGDVPLPTVSVQGSQPRPPKQEQAATPAPRSAPTPPAPSSPSTSTASTGTTTTPGTAASTVGQAGPSSTSYQAPTSGLTRLPTPLLSTPQTVNVVTQQVMQEQVNASVKDALRNVAGVTFRAGEGGNQGDTPYIRGFSAQSDIFRDGVRDPGWYTRDAFPVQAVEVFKGPAAVLFGRGSTGGVINLVSKTPFERNAVEGTITGNSGPGERATIDANGQAADNVWARLVAMGQEYDIAGRDHIEQNRYGFSPSLLWKATEDTKVTLAYIYQHDQNVPDYGIPFLSPQAGIPRLVAPVERSNWYGILSGPLPDTEKVDAHIATAKIEHEFNDQVKLVNTTRYNYVDRLQRNVFPEPNDTVPVPPNLNVNWTPNRAQIFVTNTQLANQTDLIAKFSTGFVDHTVATGVDVTRESRDFLRNQFAGQAGTNFLNPDPWRYGGIPQPPTASQWTYGVAKDVGAYIADQAKITKYFELLGSFRYDQYWFGQDAPVADPIVQRIATLNNMGSWRAGAVWHPTEKSSIYVMRGTSFNPSADNLTLSVTTVNGALSLAKTSPEQTTTSEVGAKADVLNGKLTLQTAFFNTTKANLRVTDPSTMLTYSAGNETALGWEASAAGNLTSAWAIIASYTYVHARIINPAVPIQYNAEPMNTPAYAFSLWTTYDVTKSLQVGAGAFYNSSVWGDLQTAAPYTVANTALVPAWWRFDAMAAYKLSPKVTLQFNVYNLTDKYYFESAYTNWAVPGQRRTFALTLRGHT